MREFNDDGALRNHGIFGRPTFNGGITVGTADPQAEILTCTMTHEATDQGLQR
jgi:hypothetical protein